MGNSMGGSLGIALAANHPELVTGLVLVNPALPRPRGNLKQMSRTAKFAALTLPRAATPIVRARARALGHEGLVDATLAMAMTHPEKLDPDIRARLISLSAERHGFPDTAASYTLAGGSLFRYLAGPIRRDVASIHCPTLIMHGRRDRLVPVAWAARAGREPARLGVHRARELRPRPPARATRALRRRGDGLARPRRGRLVRPLHPVLGPLTLSAGVFPQTMAGQRYAGIFPNVAAR